MKQRSGQWDLMELRYDGMKSDQSEMWWTKMGWIKFWWIKMRCTKTEELRSDDLDQIRLRSDEEKPDVPKPHELYTLQSGGDRMHLTAAHST